MPAPPERRRVLENQRRAAILETEIASQRGDQKPTTVRTSGRANIVNGRPRARTKVQSAWAFEVRCFRRSSDCIGNRVANDVECGRYQRNEDAMHRNMFRSNIHRATVTDALIDYEGSVAIDSAFLEAEEARLLRPRIVFLDAKTRMTSAAAPEHRVHA